MSLQHVAVREVRPDDPDVAAIIAIHVASMDNSDTPADACHRLDLTGLLDPSITFFAAYDNTGDASIHQNLVGPTQDSAGTSATGQGPVGIGAFAQRAAEWGEVKSMHVLEVHRGRGISHSLLRAIEAAARARSVGILRLETARHFTAAISLYERSGFVECGPFADYADHPASLFMEKRLT